MKYIMKTVIFTGLIAVMVSGAIAADLLPNGNPPVSLADYHIVAGVDCMDCHTNKVNAYQHIEKSCTDCHEKRFLKKKEKEKGSLKAHNVDYIKK